MIFFYECWRKRFYCIYEGEHSQRHLAWFRLNRAMLRDGGGEMEEGTPRSQEARSKSGDQKAKGTRGWWGHHD